MIESKTKSSRRAFFLNGGAVLGAGVATTAGASTLIPKGKVEALSQQDQLKQLQQQLAATEDREAIRQLHSTFTSHVENQRYEAAAQLFNEQAQLNLSGAIATSKPAIEKLFIDQYRNQKGAAIHSAYRQNTSQQKDAVTVSEDRQQATATFHVDVALSTPLQGDSTLVKMARLQGQMSSHYWESGRLEATYVKTHDQWKMASLNYLAS